MEREDHFSCCFVLFPLQFQYGLVGLLVSGLNSRLSPDKSVEPVVESVVCVCTLR